jgi:hypothetical protein
MATHGHNGFCGLIGSIVIVTTGGTLEGKRSTLNARQDQMKTRNYGLTVLFEVLLQPSRRTEKALGAGDSRIVFSKLMAFSLSTFKLANAFRSYFCAAA